MIKYKASAKYVLITFASKTESVKMKKEEEKRIDGVFFLLQCNCCSNLHPKIALHCRILGENHFRLIIELGPSISIMFPIRLKKLFFSVTDFKYKLKLQIGAYM